MCTFALFLCVSEKGYVSFFVRVSKELSDINGFTYAIAYKE